MSEHRGGLGLPLLGSLLLHGGAAAALLFVRPAPSPPPPPPTYRVNLVAAPPGDRAIGVVRPPTPTPTPPATTPTPSRAVTERDRGPAVPTETKRPPRRVPPKATPTPPSPAATRPSPSTPAPTAGGGPTGGRGADVANVRTQGIDFPYPGYLENVVRQIALRFKPPRNSPFRAEVGFLIRRDGTVAELRMVTPSGAFAFDLEARGAVEAAAQARAFGPLPAGFRDDVLPVVFSFDPRLIR